MWASHGVTHREEGFDLLSRSLTEQIYYQANHPTPLLYSCCFPSVAFALLWFLSIIRSCASIHSFTHSSIFSVIHILMITHPFPTFIKCPIPAFFTSQSPGLVARRSFQVLPVKQPQAERQPLPGTTSQAGSSRAVPATAAVCGETRCDWASLATDCIALQTQATRHDEVHAHSAVL